MIAVRSTRSRFPTACVTVTAKGQFCIPKRLRDALGLVPGSRVAIDLIDDGFALRPLMDRERADAGATRRRARKEARRR